ncbi:MAG: glucose 1-dehydrogenase [Acidobacteriota bacterium]
MKLKDKVVVITGGNSGIGRATAEEFAREGAQLALFGRTESTLNEVAEAVGGALTVVGDVSKLEDLDRLFAAVRERFGRIDVLVANAGIAPFVPLPDVTEEHFDQVFDINVKGLYFTVQKALPQLPDGASVIFTGSSVSYRGMAGGSVYSATKGAVRTLARTLQAELAARAIRVNVLSPGPIETPIFDRMGLTDEAKAEMAAGITASVPAGRFGKPEEMAKAALFLASDDSSYVYGSDLLADGGFASI